MNELTHSGRPRPPAGWLLLAARWIAITSVLYLLLTPTRAGAEDRPQGEPPFTIGAEPAWLLLGGVSGGGSLASDDNGGFAGGELSVVRLRQSWWIGGYLDGGYEFAQSAPFLSVGPELGYSVIGVDGGAFVRCDEAGVELGPQGRVAIGVGVFSLFARYAFLPHAQRNQHVVQIGAVFKMPMSSPFGQGPASR